MRPSSCRPSLRTRACVRTGTSKDTVTDTAPELQATVEDKGKSKDKDDNAADELQTTA